MSVATGVLSRALDLILPPRCVGCRSFGSFLCDQCLDEMVPAAGSRCLRCWQPGRTDSCLHCYQHPPAFKALRSAFVYTGPARSAVLALKFQGVSACAPALAGPIAKLLEVWDPPVDVIVPVPLSISRRRLRGYDQAELLAGEVSRLSGIPVARKALKRSSDTSPQSQQASAESRRTNIAGAFVTGREPVTESVLLVDDVATTCATLDACARALRQAGAEAVFGLTFARED